MKFEKFLKSVGTHGEVISVNESEKWLVCDGVGMVIPRGVDNLLGTESKRDFASIVDVISTAEPDDIVKLTRAVMPRPDGKASDIYRIFTTDGGIDEIGITNADFGLLEKGDILSYFEIVIDCDEEGNPVPEDKVKTIKYILVFNRAEEIVGFITGVSAV